MKGWHTHTATEREGEAEAEGERGLPFTGSFFKGTTARVGPKQSQELGIPSGSPMWVSEAQTHGPSSQGYFSGALAGSQIRYEPVLRFGSQ